MTEEEEDSGDIFFYFFKALEKLLVGRLTVELEACCYVKGGGEDGAEDGATVGAAGKDDRWWEEKIIFSLLVSLPARAGHFIQSVRKRRKQHWPETNLKSVPSSFFSSKEQECFASV